MRRDEKLAAGTLSTLRTAASQSSDGRTVALVFATNDFVELVLNWCLVAVAAGVRWFVVVTMDTALHATLSRGGVDSAPVLLLPRLQRGVPIDKLNIIGERQRFGLHVLAAGLNVVHADADALFMRDPSSLLADGDVIASRIWGKPLSVVRKWGAGICTGFYFLRSSAASVALAREVQRAVAAKASTHPEWQQSDQYFINTVLDGMGVTWRHAGRMPPFDSYHDRMHSLERHVGVVGANGTSAGDRSGAARPLRLVMLPHVLAARACPVLKPAELAASARGRGGGGGKLRLWQHLLSTAVVLHCFPPEKASAAQQAKRTIFMGHPQHIAGEEGFQRGQGLWRLRADWRSVPPPPPTTTTTTMTTPTTTQPGWFAWLASLDNRSSAGAAAVQPGVVAVPARPATDRRAQRRADRASARRAARRRRASAGTRSSVPRVPPSTSQAIAKRVSDKHRAM